VSTYAIGDIQGCFDELEELLATIAFDRSRDRLWFVGDLVNRGPRSLETLRFVRGLGDTAVTVLGNHDLHLVMCAGGHGRHHAEDTLDEILAAPDCDEMMAWLRAQPLCHVEGGYALVHAGLLPQWTVEQARRLSEEVTSALTAPDYRDFLAHMWGSEPTAWRDDLTGWDRLRVIVNAMTRMRFCSDEGVMELRTKGPPEAAKPGYKPWFEAAARKSAGATIVCGHWSALGLRLQPGLMALDSGCLWGGSLTAVRLEDGEVFQQPCTRKVAPGGWD
jgi:bis(5'-nucleosyl)-tetraphosphatase (symmetrical)